MKQLEENELVDRLALLYQTDSLCVANVCDKVLDRSGRLLGLIRERARKIKIIATQSNESITSM